MALDNFAKEDLKGWDKFNIWKCPGLECEAKGVVLFKTKELLVGDGKMKCGVCGNTYRFEEIRVVNLENFEKYLEGIKIKAVKKQLYGKKL